MMSFTVNDVLKYLKTFKNKYLKIYKITLQLSSKNNLHY